ncbi:DUF805 domain-containing protein [Deinococcus alpinitundrae]|uniref:DUF805 domain-containing protein n=1 Tax=Deinococcus alpinitundrae TaxID=468913 RepID=UPI001379F5F4|nr:DUF805 domain-containing protein [Deinococcus alpinitundrae]
MTDFLNAVKKYAVFTGRARRHELWMFQLFYCILSLPFMLIDVLLLTPGNSQGTPVPLLTSLFSLSMLLLSLGVNLRRLHDVGRSGWWFFLAFIPLVGPIAILIFHVADRQLGRNKWGDSPKQMPYGSNLMH